MTDCIDRSLVPDGIPHGKKVFFDGVEVAAGMPPPAVRINEDVSSGNCFGSDSHRKLEISLEGELACCSSQEKIAVREELLELFSSSCGDLEACGEVWENCRVTSIDISQAHYRSNVSYTVNFSWTDPDFPDSEEAEVTDVKNVITASEDDASVTVSHTVSAKAAETADCEGCSCDIAPVTEWVNANISETAPVPQSIDIPQNQSGSTLDCPDVNERIDTINCTYEIQKTWKISKTPVVVDDGDGNLNVTSTECTTVSEGKHNKKSYNVSGSVTYAGSQSSCDDPSDPKFMADVEAAFKIKSDAALSKYSALGNPDSRSIQKSENPASINYTFDWKPEPSGDIRGDTIDTYCASGSLGSDGVFSITVSGSMVANDAKLKTQSKNCKCEAIEKDWDAGKYFGIAQEFYGNYKEIIPEEVLKRLAGPCNDSGELNPNADSESINDDPRTCAKSYSFVYTDKEEKDAQWNYTINLNHPRKKVSIQPTLGGAFCVIIGDTEAGSVSINGRRSQCCPEDEEWGDKEGLAQQFLASLLPGETLKLDDEKRFCTETKVYGTTEEDCDGQFDFSYAYGGEFGDSEEVIQLPEDNNDLTDQIKGEQEGEG